MDHRSKPRKQFDSLRQYYVQIKLTRDEHTRLCSLCSKLNLTKSQLIRAAINQIVH